MRAWQAGVVAWLVATPAQADLIGDVGECLDKSVKQAWVTAKAAAAIADMLADPELGVCVSQVLLPDPVTIAGSGTVVAVAAATQIPPGMCDAGLRDAAFDPLVDGLSGLTGLSRHKPPLQSLISEGKDKAWTYLKTTPPSALVWSRLSCGCTFYDKGAAIDDIKKVAQATTAAGKSCGKVLSQAADALGLSAAANAVGKGLAWLGNKSQCALKANDDLINGQSTPWTSYEYYQNRWRPYEQGYVFRVLQNGGKGIDLNTPLPGGLQFGSAASQAVAAAYGSLQVDYQNAGTSPSLNQLRSATLAYYKCSTAGPEEMAKAISALFYQSADAKLALAKAWLAYDAAAAEARAAKTQQIISPYEKSGVVSVLTLNAIAAELRAWTDTGWAIHRGNPSGNPADALALAWKQHQAPVAALVAQADADLAAAKNKSSVAPLRRLSADGNLGKLEQLGEASNCQSLHPLLAAACQKTAEEVRQQARAVLKARDNQPNMTQSEKQNYGKADGSVQLTSNSRYTYAPHIPDPRDDAAWASSAYDTVLKADSQLRENFVSALQQATAVYPPRQQQLQQMLDFYQAGCGEAIGKPGSVATPLCREYLANGLAACLAASAPSPAGPAATSALTTSAVKGLGLGLGGKPVTAIGSASAAPALGTATPVPGKLGLQCEVEAKDALDRYAKQHQQAPQQDVTGANYAKLTATGGLGLTSAPAKPDGIAVPPPKPLPGAGLPGALPTSQAQPEGGRPVSRGRLLAPPPAPVSVDGNARAGQVSERQHSERLLAPPAPAVTPGAAGMELRLPTMPAAETAPAERQLTPRAPRDVRLPAAAPGAEADPVPARRFPEADVTPPSRGALPAAADPALPAAAERLAPSTTMVPMAPARVPPAPEPVTAPAPVRVLPSAAPATPRALSPSDDDGALRR